jgi:hypothetical protein
MALSVITRTAAGSHSLKINYFFFGINFTAALIMQTGSSSTRPRLDWKIYGLGL